MVVAGNTDVPARLLMACVILLVVAGCTSSHGIRPVDRTERETLWQQHNEKVSGISGWNLKGKMAVKTGHKGGSATLIWNYQQDKQKIELYGPFGGGRVRITTQPDHAVLKDTKGKVIEGNNAAEVLYERLGWQVPFEELQYWARGIPSDYGPNGDDLHGAAVDITLDNSGRLKTLKQGNWLVEYQDYKTVNQLDLPRKFLITAVPGSMEIYSDDGEYIGDELSVKMILKRWWDVQLAE